MDIAVLTAVATPFLTMLAMLWHQQRSILKQLGEIGERLARIEVYLGMGMPPSAAARAAGRSLVSKPVQAEAQPEKFGEQGARPAESG